MQTSFYVSFLKDTVYKTNTENVEFVARLWSFSSFSLLLTMSKEKIKKENFTDAKKNPQDQFFFK